MDLIPQIANEELLSLASKIKPLVRSKSGSLLEIEVTQNPEKLRNQSFIWEPITGKVFPHKPFKKKIVTYHTCGFYGLFKPSIAEVLSQISEEDRKWCTAFVLDTDLTMNNSHKDGGHQWTNTYLYD